MQNDLQKYQSKSITPVDEYACTLSDDLKRVAEDELRETAKIRSQCIKALRDWVMENPRIIKCRLDSQYLLKVLRFRKFSIPLAQETLERILLYREGLYGYDFYSNLDPLKPHVLELLDKGLVVPFPKRDKHGRLTIYVRFSLIDLSIPNVGNVAFTLHALIQEQILEDDENQIRGLNYVLDMSGAHLRQLLIFPIDLWLKFGKYYEKICAFRQKTIHIVNINPSLMYLIKLLTANMTPKLRSRVKLYSTNIAETGIVELDNLPIEYGGTIPLKTITDYWKEALLSKRDFYLNYKNMKVNHALYPQNYLECSIDSLKVPISQLDFNENLKTTVASNSGMIGSFRKLEID